MRQDLADKKDLVTTIADCLAHEFLGSAIAVHLGGIDQRHAEVEPEAKGCNLIFATGRVLA